MVLHWIRGGGQYKQFVENRVRKIQAKPEINLRHVPTEENPADLASRGGDVQHCGGMVLNGWPNPRIGHKLL